MKNLKTHCIVLKSSAVREIDKSLVLFSPDIGIFSLMAFGACKSKNRYGGKLEPFSILSAELMEKTVGTETEYRFKEIILEEYFENLTASFETVMTAHFFCEILLKNNTGGESRKLFALLYQALKALNTDTSAANRVLINFLIRYLAYTGFLAPLTECSECTHLFSPEETVFIRRSDYQPCCRHCVEGDCVPFERDSIRYLNTVLSLHLQESVQIPINKNEERKLKSYFISQLKDISGFHYKTLESLR